MAPPLQIGRPIGFAGTGGNFEFIIRPEELTRFEPSRLAVQQTLGGAWIDGFDRGIITIKIQGHTGWRGAAPVGAGSFTATSGIEQFNKLRANSFINWHAERARIVAGGGDPNQVELIFIDTLNGYTDLVAPKSFTLRRSKSRPLLMQYSIEMLVLQDYGNPSGGGGAGSNFGYIFGGTLLEGIAAQVDGLVSGFSSVVGGALGGGIGNAFSGVVNQALGQANLQATSFINQGIGQAAGAVSGALGGGILGNAAGSLVQNGASSLQSSAIGLIGGAFGI